MVWCGQIFIIMLGGLHDGGVGGDNKIERCGSSLVHHHYHHN